LSKANINKSILLSAVLHLKGELNENFLYDCWNNSLWGFLFYYPIWERDDFASMDSLFCWIDLYNNSLGKSNGMNESIILLGDKND
jgi:hypothetical protein